MTSRAESRTDVEGYLLVADAARNAALLGWGVAAGLEVSATAGTAGVTVGVGAGVDIDGRLILLADGGVAITDPLVGAGGMQNIPTAAVTGAGVGLDTSGLTGEVLATVAWREIEDVIDGLLVVRQAPWLRLADPASFTEDGRQLVLAAVTLGPGGVVQDLRAGARRLVTVTAGRLELQSPATAGPLAVGQPAAAEMKVTDHGGLAINLLPATPILATTGTGDLALLPGGGNVGIGIPTPTHPLHLTANPGLRQNSLYLSGNTGWSSLAYNAHHDDNNQNWTFPDPTRPAVSIEMDDRDGNPRFQVWTTTTQNTQNFQQRLSIDGNTGRVTVLNDLVVEGGAALGGVVSFGAATSGGAVRVKSLSVLDEGTTTAGAWTSLGSNAFFDGGWKQRDPAKAGVSLHMNADGGGQEFRFLRMEPNGANTRNVAVLGSGTSFITESKLGIGTSQPTARLTVDDPSADDTWNTAAFHKAAVGPNWSHIHWGPTGDWYIRSAAPGGKVVLQDLGGLVGVGTSSPDLPLTVGAGARFNGVVAGAAAPGIGYPWAYETVGVANPAFNLRLQSPNSIIFHAGGNPPDPKATLGGDGTLTVSGNIGTHGFPAAAAHQGWGGGIRTWDVEAHGTIWSANDIIADGAMRARQGFRTNPADVAELFDSAEAVEPGDVVCAGADGAGIVASSVAGDPAVLGVVSTAAGLVLNAADTVEGEPDNPDAVAIALCGRVPCKVTAENGPIGPGDLLIASATRGHAMRVGDDNGRPVAGTILGKALGRLDEGAGMIDVLVTLA